jgi:conjugal transfer pilus assembly protein TrbC
VLISKIFPKKESIKKMKGIKEIKMNKKSMGILFLLFISKLSFAIENKELADTVDIQEAQIIQKILPYQAEVQAFFLAQQAYQNNQNNQNNQNYQSNQNIQPLNFRAQLPGINGFAKKIDNKIDDKNAEAVISGDVLIFISFSMPDVSLKQWAEQASRLHTPLVIRGLIHNSFDETQKKIAQFTASEMVEIEKTGKKGGVVLDPRLFTDYEITQVPAVVVRNTTMECLPTQSCPHIYPFDVVMGDIGLDSALDIIAHQEEGAAKEVASHALQVLRKSV